MRRLLRYLHPTVLWHNLAVVLLWVAVLSVVLYFLLPVLHLITDGHLPDLFWDVAILSWLLSWGCKAIHDLRDIHPCKLNDGTPTP